jgi:hypothetical protein
MPIVIVNNLDDGVADVFAIFIKPNLAYPNFKTGVTTWRDFVVPLDLITEN